MYLIEHFCRGPAVILAGWKQINSLFKKEDFIKNSFKESFITDNRISLLSKYSNCLMSLPHDFTIS